LNYRVLLGKEHRLGIKENSEGKRKFRGPTLTSHSFFMPIRKKQVRFKGGWRHRRYEDR
jgi:hypothetical protein